MWAVTAKSPLLTEYNQAASVMGSVLGGVNVLIHFQYHKWFVSVDSVYVWSLCGYLFLCTIFVIVFLRVVSFSIACLYNPDMFLGK